MTQQRYDRQRRFAPIGDEGQQRIEAATVLVIGVGALGSVAAEVLARAGVGRLRIVDRDTVEWSNLQRQSLYTEADAREGLAKVHAAAARLGEINSEIRIEPIAADVTAANIEGLFAGVDLVVDGTDNFDIRMLINDVALETGTPWVHGGCLGASGQVFLFDPGRTICFRCLVPSVPDPTSVATCDQAGVLGSATHVVASLQANEALKYLAAGAAAATPKIQTLDLWEGRFRSLDPSDLRSGECRACDLGHRDFLHRRGGVTEPVVLCGRNAVQLPPPAEDRVLDLSAMSRLWEGLGETQVNRFLARLQIDPTRSITLFRDGRAVINGTEDAAEAKTLYARFVGS
ncbi:ThiF family adenylyltransferase [Candidatus Laterigemmans baculatus]|uniref:ThiF family adenylyltransferase n=1 Tax=Candidatus Laterigemmans baculatus TaxID=2770505 RepID=UPI0013D9328B|nr:ThiF family adenylyltransferase [Candidatus Laterigemmans baculatus]